jgi:hypothetical protein
LVSLLKLLEMFFTARKNLNERDLIIML